MHEKRTEPDSKTENIFKLGSSFINLVIMSWSHFLSDFLVSSGLQNDKLLKLLYSDYQSKLWLQLLNSRGWNAKMYIDKHVNSSSPTT